MAGRAVHFGRAEMNIGNSTFAETGVFAEYTAAMARSAHCLQGWTGERMAGQQSSADIIRPADMTLPATGMTCPAVPGLGLLKDLHGARLIDGCPCRNGIENRCQGEVKALSGGPGDFLVTLPAHRFRIGKRRIVDVFAVRCLPVVISRVAPMAILARNGTVIAIQKILFNIDFFI